MSYYKELDYGTADIGNVVGVQFSVLSPEEIERRSVAEIITQETYDGDMPKVGGLFDRRMGVLDPGMLCLSCGQKSNLCPGHLGHIRLAAPVFHVQFMNIIMKTIQIVCYRCAKTLVNLEDSHIKRNLLKRGPKQRFVYLYSLSSKVKRCGEKNPCGCGAIQPSTIKRDTNGIGRIILEFKLKDEEKKRLIWTAEQVYRIFKQISTDEAELMGFNKFWCRPDWLICTILPVPPPSVRPSVRNDTNTRMEDDLTHKLCDIVKTNRALKQKIEANAPKNIVDEWSQLLQYHVSTLIDNNLPGVPQAVQRSGRPLKSIKDRLKSKEGRVRGNLMGKRVDFSARSVISPDPNLEIDELGVPIKIAKNLTFPEIVTKYNKEWLTMHIINGPDTYPGAKSYKRNTDKQVISLKHIDRHSILLMEGDVVNRHLVNGDIILFNRQPSLHRMSMMAHRVRVMPYNTFRMNPNATTPYNADFDGDEMNMHVPQSEQTRIELEALACVSTQIITPAENRPIISIVQDTLVGAYRFTKYDNYLTRSQIMDLLAWNKLFNGIIPEPDVKAGTLLKDLPDGFPTYKYDLSQDLWSGRTILSTVLPAINMTKPNSSYNSFPDGHSLRYQHLVKIDNGKIVSGVFDKSLLGANEQGVIHIIFNEYGPKAAKDFLDNVMGLITNWMLMSGFSVGVSDLIINEAAQTQISNIIADKKDKVAAIVQSIHDGTFQNDTGKSNATEFEIKVNGALNQAIQDTGIKVAEHQLKNNRMVNMVESGSKGTKVNIAQITACVGQQNVDGKRCPYGFSNRTLPHFNKFDDGPLARGFVENSFLQGLNPQEFFFHSMGGREGIIDTAIKTSESGYIQRRLIKAMEDLKVCQDQTIRGDTGNIVQFLYGEDGFNPEKVEKQKIPSVGMNIHDLQKNYLISPSENWIKFLDPHETANFNALKTEARKEFYSSMLVHYQRILSDRQYIIENVFKMAKKDEIYHPVNIRRILNNAVSKFKQSGDYLCDFNPQYALKKIEYLMSKLIVKENNPANRNYHILINSLLSPKYLMLNFKLTKSALDYVVEQIEFQYMESFAAPGQLVGIIAAQSIGQPCTQMSSVFGSKALIITEGEDHYYGPIGKFIDDIIQKNKSKVVTIGQDSVVLDLVKPFHIVGVSNDEKTSWKAISQVSRHPANGGLVKVITRSGKTTTATLTHSFLKRSPTGIEPILGSDLKEGDRIPVASFIPTISNPIMTKKIGKTVYNLDYDFGWFAGIYLADGCLNGSSIRITKIAPIVEQRLNVLATQYNLVFTTRYYQGEYGPGKDNIITDKLLANFIKNEFNTGSYDKVLPAWVYASNIDFIRGLLSGYFDGDGNVNASKHMLRVSSRSQSLINDICVLLAYVGIFASLLKETTINQPGKTQYNLSVPKKYAEQFKTQVGFNMTEKADELDKIIQWNNRNVRHDNKEYIDKIPACGQLIADIGRELNLPEQSAYYRRWINKASIGRRTLQNYISTFETEQAIQQIAGVDGKISLLKQAVNSNVIWDEIVKLEYLDDPKEFVYDFTVPGNDSFMIDTGVLVHNTLNTFHFAGISAKSAVTRGLPRLKEIISVSKNIKSPQMTVFLDEPYRFEKEQAKSVLNTIEITTIKDICISSRIYFDPSTSEDATQIDEDKELMEIYDYFQDIEGVGDSGERSPWILRLEFDKSKMFDKDIRMSDVYYTIQSKFANDLSSEINFVYSDDNSSKLIFRFQFIPKDKSPAEEKSEDMILTIKNLEKTVLNDIVIKGVKNITSASMEKTDNILYKIGEKSEDYNTKPTWVLYTEGSNLLDIFSHPNVDASRTFTNDIFEIYEVLGIEAAREVILNEITDLIGSDGTYINFRHTALLADIMVNRGAIMSIDRHGINKSDRGPLPKCSFEETTDMLAQAAIFSELDKMTGVSSNIMFGQEVPSGTGFVDVFFDEEKYISSLATINEDNHIFEQSYEEEYEKASKIDMYCAENNFAFNTTI